MGVLKEKFILLVRLAISIEKIFDVNLVIKLTWKTFIVDFKDLFNQIISKFVDVNSFILKFWIEYAINLCRVACGAVEFMVLTIIFKILIKVFSG